MLPLFRPMDACSCHKAHLSCSRGISLRLTSGKGKLTVCQMSAAVDPALLLTALPLALACLPSLKVEWSQFLAVKG